MVADEEEQGEDEQDRALLWTDAGGAMGEEGGEDSGDSLTKEIALVRYFHRLTGLIFATVSDAISRVDGENVRRGDDGGNGYGNEDGRGEGGLQGLGVMQAGPTTTKDDHEEGGEGGEGEEECDPYVAAATDDGGESEPLLPPSSQADNPQQGHESGSGSECGSRDPTQTQPPATVDITSQDMMQMGLDVWSSGDRSFVEEFVQLWWGRQVLIRGGSVECCGIRVL